MQFFVCFSTQWQLRDKDVKFMVIQSEHISLYFGKYT